MTPKRKGPVSGFLMCFARAVSLSVSPSILRASWVTSAPKVVRVMFLRCPRLTSGLSKILSNSLIPAPKVDWVTLQISAAALNDFSSSSAIKYSICRSVGLIIIVIISFLILNSSDFFTIN